MTTYDKHQNQILYANLRRTRNIDPTKVKFDPTSGHIFSVEDGVENPWTAQGYAWAKDAVAASNRRRVINSQIAADRNSPATFFGEGTYDPGEVSYETTETGVQMPISYTPAKRKPLAPGQSYRTEIYDEKTGERIGFASVRRPEPGEVVYGTTINEQGQSVPISNKAAENRRPYIAQQLAKSEESGDPIPMRAFEAMTPEERVSWMNSKEPPVKAFEQTAGLPGAPVQGWIEQMEASQDKAEENHRRERAKQFDKEAREALERRPENHRAHVLDMIQEVTAAKGEDSPELAELFELAKALGGLGPIDRRKLEKENAAEAERNRRRKIVEALSSNDNAAMIRAWEYLMTPRERGRSVKMRGKPKKPNWNDPVVQSLLFGTPIPKKEGR